MNFASDNVGPAAPEIMAALSEANTAPHMPYGNDPFTARAEALVREVFEAPDASVHLVATGSAANALALATLTRPWDAIFCHADAHVELDECGAPEFYTSGAKLRRVPGENAKITPETLRTELDEITPGNVHSVQRGPVTLTQLTELGTAYSRLEIEALTSIAREAGLKVHLDGARIANAVAAANVSPAEMTWKAGVDVLSLGGTKNGCLGVEAVVFFDPQLAWEVALRRKRAGHLWSKSKFLGAQMAAYLENGLWLELAGKANARMAQLIDGLAAVPEAHIVAPPAGNLVFLDLPKSAHDRAFAKGAQYKLRTRGAPEPDDHLVRARIVCDWSKTEAEIDQLLSAWRRAA
ncbi:MAG: beta-eliminating lyase-related protein [Pseudomonadota bacterium]